MRVDGGGGLRGARLHKHSREGFRTLIQFQKCVRNNTSYYLCVLAEARSNGPV